MESAISPETIWRGIGVQERETIKKRRAAPGDPRGCFTLPPCYSYHAAGLLFYGADYDRAFPFNQVMYPSLGGDSDRFARHRYHAAIRRELTLKNRQSVLRRSLGAVSFSRKNDTPGQVHEMSERI